MQILPPARQSCPIHHFGGMGSFSFARAVGRGCRDGFLSLSLRPALSRAEGRGDGQVFWPRNLPEHLPGLGNEKRVYLTVRL